MSEKRPEISIDDKEIPVKQQLRIREENKDCIIIVNWHVGTWMRCTANVMDILELCDGKRTVADICSHYASEFEDVASEVIYDDVKSVLTRAKNVSFVNIV